MARVTRKYGGVISDTDGKEISVTPSSGAEVVGSRTYRGPFAWLTIHGKDHDQYAHLTRGQAKLIALSLLRFVNKP